MDHCFEYNSEFQKQQSTGQIFLSKDLRKVMKPYSGSSGVGRSLLYFTKTNGNRPQNTLECRARNKQVRRRERGRGRGREWVDFFHLAKETPLTTWKMLWLLFFSLILLLVFVFSVGSKSGNSNSVSYICTTTRKPLNRTSGPGKVDAVEKRLMEVVTHNASPLNISFCAIVFLPTIHLVDLKKAPPPLRKY